MATTDKLFINLSNHPSNKWSEDQINAVKEKWNKLINVTFPDIDPEATSTDINNLCEEYINKILSIIEFKECTIENTTVHIMGEMTCG